MKEETLNDIKEILKKRDDNGLGYTGNAMEGKTYHGLLASDLIRHDEIQVYVLLKILDRLERIETAVSSDKETGR